MTRYILLIISCAVLSLKTNAQRFDALVWASTSFEGKINKDFNFELNTQLRFDDNASRLSSAFLQSGIDYELNKLFKISIGHRLSNSRNGVNFSLKHRVFSDLSFDTGLTENLNVKLRLRTQHDFDRLKALNEYIQPSKRTMLRLKYGFEYSIDNWKPSVSNEFFFNLNENAISRYRINLGLSYKVSKRHGVKFEYKFQQNLAKVILKEHIYRISYTYKLKGKLLN